MPKQTTKTPVARMAARKAKFPSRPCGETFTKANTIINISTKYPNASMFTNAPTPKLFLSRINTGINKATLSIIW